jgi:hypothetical protein
VKKDANVCTNEKDTNKCVLKDQFDRKPKLLPKWNHRFHVNCIDIWFQFHST